MVADSDASFSTAGMLRRFQDAGGGCGFAQTINILSIISLLVVWFFF